MIEFLKLLEDRMDSLNRRGSDLGSGLFVGYPAFTAFILLICALVVSSADQFFYFMPALAVTILFYVFGALTAMLVGYYTDSRRNKELGFYGVAFVGFNMTCWTVIIFFFAMTWPLGLTLLLLYLTVATVVIAKEFKDKQES